MKAKTKKEKYNKIKAKKRDTPIDVLCDHSPREFATYLYCCRALRFEDKPDYTYLRNLFRELFWRQGFAGDYRFDWMMLRPPRHLKKKYPRDSKLPHLMRSKRSDEKQKHSPRMFKGYSKTKPEKDTQGNPNIWDNSYAGPHSGLTINFNTLHIG